MKFLSILLLVVVSISISISISGYAYGPETQEDVYKKNWGLYSVGLDIPEAWTLSKGSKNVVVAVVDTGIDMDSQFFSGSIWHGLPVGLYGWDFNTNTENPTDDNGHGTHVSGIIKAVSHDVTLMSLKYYEESNNGMTNVGNSIRAFNYAIDHGANIISYSSQGYEFSEDEYLAIKRAEKKNILIVVASGNDHKNIDLESDHSYPASYGLPNVISVSSLTVHDYLLSSSNFGPKTVDVAAPGENIYSTLPGNRFGYMSGTSQATAFVTGEAVLLLGLCPKLTPKELKYIITNSVQKLPGLSDKVSSGGKINSYVALKMLKNMLAKKRKVWNYNQMGNQ